MAVTVLLLYKYENSASLMNETVIETAYSHKTLTTHSIRDRHLKTYYIEYNRKSRETR